MGQIKDIGLPFITNFDKEAYNAESQNWDITQDDKGVMYFANSQGLLSFNGSEWHTYPLPNNSIVRSVAFYKNKIYVGGFNEFGYFKNNPYGNLTYTSLSSQLAKDEQSFDEIWNIYVEDGKIFLQSYLNVFILDNNHIELIEPKSRFGFSYLVDHEIYIIDREFGLYKIRNKKLVPVYTNDIFFVKNEIMFITKQQNQLLIATTQNGIYKLKNNLLTPWNVSINQTFIKNQIYCGIALSDNQMAIGTIQNGLYIINNNGKVIQHVNRLKGLQNNTVLSTFYDKNQNLWLGLDNGIDLLEVNSPFTIFNYSSGIESTYASLVYNNILYIGTNQGLFARPYNEIDNQHMHDAKFTLVEGTMGQVWCLKEIDNTLFCGHNLGTFIIDKFSAKLISNIQGGWDYAQVPWNKNYIIGGNYSGLHVFEKNNNHTWQSKQQVNGYIESSKKLVFDQDKNLWISHALKGMFRIVLSDDLLSIKSFEQYNNNQGLPEITYNITSSDHKFYVIANEKIYAYESNTNTFWIKNDLNGMFDKISGLTIFFVDANQDVWYFTRNNFGVFRRLEDGTVYQVSKPFNRLSHIFQRNSYENITSINKTETLIGSQEGIIHYQSDFVKNYNTEYHTYISSIKIKKRTGSQVSDSMLNTKNLILTNNKTSIPYKYNSLSFNFYTPFYEAPKHVMHAFRLKGFDNKWSNWKPVTYKEYTNLHEGNYTFEVKAKNIYNNESVVEQFQFEIKPPIYRSTLAIIIYILIFLAIAIVLLIYFKLKIERTRAIENKKLVIKEEEFKKEAELTEQRIEKLEKEKFESNMRLKNIELANTTMNLVQKNKLLTKVKNDLMQVSNKARSNAVKLDIKQLIIKIDKDINHDQNLKVFDKYFDQVHQDFVKRIKEKHPSLTPKDLRLCAYLRMNISTKEIAPLMNVSIRGLEISRYRLRKKLGLAHEENLVDYIMKI